MNRLDAIRAVGDFITEIDVARGEIKLEPAVRLRLDDARTLLNHRVIQLVEGPSDEVSERVQEQLAKIEARKFQIVRGNQIDLMNFLKSLDEFLGNTRFLGSLPGGTTTDDPGKKKP